ncbi:MAG: methyl-accepting chemotaxis protein [Treponema sp.]|nr:methyl-accepting chemotaxis protein [Treponema sp.]
MSDTLSKDDKASAKNLTILFLGTFLPILIVTITAGATLFSLSTSLTKRHAQSEAKAAGQKLKTDILAFIDPVIAGCEDFASFAKIRHDTESIDDLIHAIGSNLPYSASAYYGTKISRFEQGGLYFDSTDWVPPDDWQMSDEPWYAPCLNARGKVLFNDPVFDIMTKTLCATVGKSVPLGDQEGVFAVDLQLSVLTDIMSSISISERGKVFLVLSDGTYLTNPDENKVSVANYLSDSALSRPASEYFDGTTKAFVEKGQYYAVVPIEAAGWYIVAEGPISDFTGGTVSMIIIFELILSVFAVVSSLLNIGMIKRMRRGEQELGRNIYSESEGLVAYSRETAETAQNQSAAVKEIVATMEDCTALSEDISRQITDVSSLAVKTKGDVADGVELIADNVAQLREIAEANTITIDGIKELGDKITNIWDIVTLINSVADQAKIIAFNAELEASSAGEAGKNFHIVATEIRRLADSIIDGTKEIKGKISEIEKSSDGLILMSENGTSKIEKGVASARTLEERFASMKNASEITAESAGNITSIIRQQTSATEQILITLKQISAGVESFTKATAHISAASESLKGIAKGLG